MLLEHDRRLLQEHSIDTELTLLKEEGRQQVQSQKDGSRSSQPKNSVILRIDSNHQNNSRGYENQSAEDNSGIVHEFGHALQRSEVDDSQYHSQDAAPEHHPHKVEDRFSSAES